MTPHYCASTPTKSISSPRLISEEFCSTRTTSRTDCTKVLRITHHESRITPMKWFVARNLYLQGLMDERDFRNYYELFNTLLERIHRRARDFEQRIPPAYLQQLNERYAEWVERFRLCPILTVDAERLDLAHLDSLVAEMQARLPSLFPLIER